MAKIVLILNICIVLFICECVADKPVKVDSCVFKIGEHTTIHLENIFKDSNDKYLQDSKEFNNSVYTVYYLGCKDVLFKSDEVVKGTNQTFTTTLVFHNHTFENATENNKTIVKNDHEFKSIGDSKQIDFIEDPKQVNSYIIVYREGNGIQAKIDLVCSRYPTSRLSIIGDPTGPTKNLVLFSPAACPINEKIGYSTGTVLLIIFFTVFFVYLIGGVLFNYLIKGARGSELIPNVNFWRNLPGLIKDGTIFLLSGCDTRYAETTYDRI